MKAAIYAINTRLLGSINKRTYQSVKSSYFIGGNSRIMSYHGGQPVKVLNVCKENDLANGEMKEVDVEGFKLLVVKEQGKFHVLGNKCTHYGAPLAKGAYCDGIIRCPWHGACFNVKTGDIEDFPGLDSIPVYETKIENGQVVVKASESQLNEKKRILTMCQLKPSSTAPVVIIGGGGSGLSCAESLRQNNYSGRILILSADLDLPYDRPKLSKALDIEIDAILLRKADFLKQHNIEIMNGTKVISVCTKSKQVTAEGCKHFQYQNLIIASGGQPRTLTLPGANLGNIFYLRTPRDSRKIAEAVANKHLVVVGASFIGMELASWAAKKAASVTVVGNTKVPFEHVFGMEIGNAVKKLFESNGIKFKLDVNLAELKGNDKNMLQSVKLSNGEVVPADVLLAGIGVEPATQFLKGTGVELTDRGYVKVNEFLQTSCPEIYACGDVALFPLSTFGNQLANIQHWQMALKHGKIAGQNICGLKKPVHSVPFFWTVLFGKSLRYTGYNMNYDELIIHGDLEQLAFVAYFLKKDQLVAVATLGKDPVAAQIAELFRTGKKISKSDVTANKENVWQCKV